MALGVDGRRSRPNFSSLVEYMKVRRCTSLLFSFSPLPLLSEMIPSDSQSSRSLVASMAGTGSPVMRQDWKESLSDLKAMDWLHRLAHVAHMHPVLAIYVAANVSIGAALQALSLAHDARPARKAELIVANLVLPLAAIPLVLAVGVLSVVKARRAA